MPEDFDALSADLAAGLDNMADLPADGGDRPHETKDEPAAAPSVEEALTKAFDEQAGGEDQASADLTWQRELRRMSDDALRRHGIDPNERHSRGISRREAVRRLFRAEAHLLEDAPEGFAAIAKGYAASEPPERRAAILARAAEALGFSDLAGLSSGERAELERYRGQVHGAREHLRASLPQMAESVRGIVAGNPDYGRVSKTAAALMRAGDFPPTAEGIRGAFEAALGMKGLPGAAAQQEAAAKAADEARRSKLASAKAAGTPQTKSAPARVADPTSNKDVRALLEEAWAERFGAGA